MCVQRNTIILCRHYFGNHFHMYCFACSQGRVDLQCCQVTGPSSPEHTEGHWQRIKCDCSEIC